MTKAPSRPTPNSSSDARKKTTSPETSSFLLLLLAWLWAGIPLLWGISQTVHKAMELFK